MTTQKLLTPHQRQYFAWVLTRRAAGDSVESLASTLVDSQVDLNPPSGAALFACRNPLSRGVILADDIGLPSFKVGVNWHFKQGDIDEWIAA